MYSAGASFNAYNRVSGTSGSGGSGISMEEMHSAGDVAASATKTAVTAASVLESPTPSFLSCSSSTHSDSTPRTAFRDASALESPGALELSYFGPAHSAAAGSDRTHVQRSLNFSDDFSAAAAAHPSDVFTISGSSQFDPDLHLEKVNRFSRFEGNAGGLISFQPDEPLFDKLYAVYSVIQAGLAQLQKHPKYGATIAKVQKVMLFTDTIGLISSANRLYQRTKRHGLGGYVKAAALAVPVLTSLAVLWMNRRLNTPMTQRLSQILYLNRIVATLGLALVSSQRKTNLLGCAAQIFSLVKTTRI